MPLQARVAATETLLNQLVHAVNARDAELRDALLRDPVVRNAILCDAEVLEGAALDEKLRDVLALKKSHVLRNAGTQDDKPNE